MLAVIYEHCVVGEGLAGTALKELAQLRQCSRVEHWNFALFELIELVRGVSVVHDLIEHPPGARVRVLEPPVAVSFVGVMGEGHVPVGVGREEPARLGV